MRIFISTLLCVAVLGNTAFAEQICEDSINRSAPDGRFAIIRDGSLVIDRVTQLLWQRCPVGYTFTNSGTIEQFHDDQCIEESEVETTFTWQGALQATDAIRQGGLLMRMPNIKELSSIVESSCGWPATNILAFPDTPAIDFWSNTPNGVTGARTVSFDTGLVTFGNRVSPKAVRLVADFDLG